jgi:hypothetical protein
MSGQVDLTGGGNMNGWLAALEGLLVFGLVLGFGIWQLVSVSRAQRADTERAAAAERAAAEPPSAEGAGHPEGQQQPDPGRPEAVER